MNLLFLLGNSVSISKKFRKWSIFEKIVRPPPYVFFGKFHFDTELPLNAIFDDFHFDTKSPSLNRDSVFGGSKIARQDAEGTGFESSGDKNGVIPFQIS